MSSRTPKRPTGYRKPEPVEQKKGGFLSGILQPRAAVATPMPKGRTTFVRGLAVVMGSPVMLVTIPVVLMIQWVVLVALGFQGPFTALVATFEWIGPGTTIDIGVSELVASNPGQQLAFMFGAFIVRSVVLALVTTMAVERLRTGAVSGWAARRALRVFPVVLAGNMLTLFILLVGQFIVPLLGAQFAFFGTFILTAGIVYLTAFGPAIAADEARGMPASMQRGIRAARMPGAGNMVVAGIVTLGAILLNGLFLPSAGLSVNPSIAQWAGVLVANVLNVAVVAMFAFRYLSVAHEVPEPAPPPAKRR